MNNPIFDELCKLAICDNKQIVKIQDFVRDRNDIEVWRCNKSNAIFLGDVQHMDISHYDQKAPTHQHGTKSREIITTNDDTQRRFKSFSNIVRGKNWLDIGTGSGAILDVLGPLTVDFAAVEPQEEASDFLNSMGYKVFRRLDDVPKQKFHVVTLFHVFEHLIEPMEVLKNIHSIMTDDGTIVIEVPHAKDFLIEHSKAFREHTFWSEHLFLHTRETLNALLKAAGFEVLSIEGVQRYPLANHLHWLIKGEPGGQIHWSFLEDETLAKAYEASLAKNNITDTLVLFGKKVS